MITQYRGIQLQLSELLLENVTLIFSLIMLAYILFILIYVLKYRDKWLRSTEIDGEFLQEHDLLQEIDLDDNDEKISIEISKEEYKYLKQIINRIEESSDNVESENDRQSEDRE